MPIDRKEQAKAAVVQAADFPDVLKNPNVRAMEGEWAGCYRLRIGSYRAIFQIVREGPIEQFQVLVVGPRGDVY